MKIDSKSDFLISRYQINMDYIISPYYNLILDLWSDNASEEEGGNDCSALIKEVFDVSTILDDSVLPQPISKDAFLPILAKFLEDNLYLEMNTLSDKVLFLNRNDCIVISRHPNNKEVKRALATWIKSYNPIEKLFELIVPENIRKISESLKCFFNENNYSIGVKVSGEKQWQSCVFPTEWIKKADIDVIPIDPCSIWIEHNFSEHNNIKFDNCEQLYSSGRPLGVSCDNSFFAYENMDMFITNEKYPFYFCEMMDRVYSSSPKGKVSNKFNEHFLESAKNPVFSRLLSHLQYNLYISDNVQMPDDYRDMFESVYCLNKLPGLESHMLFVGEPSEEQIHNERTLSGTYELKKSGSDYNLRNWVNAAQNGYKLSTSSKAKVFNCKSVFALKPQYSYYFLSKYYEDFFSSILEELGCYHKCGVSLYLEGNNNAFIEIDALIFKPDGKLIYVENKTCMNKNNIEATMKKIVAFQKIISEEYANVTIDYYLTAPYCDESVEQNFLFFIKNERIEQREGVKNNILQFDIPLAQFENLNLHCIIEPEYERMKSIVEEKIK